MASRAPSAQGLSLEQHGYAYGFMMASHQKSCVDGSESNEIEREQSPIMGVQWHVLRIESSFCHSGLRRAAG